MASSRAISWTARSRHSSSAARLGAKPTTVAMASSSVRAASACPASSRLSFSAAVPVQPRRAAREKPYSLSTSWQASSALRWQRNTRYCSCVSAPARSTWVSSLFSASSRSSASRSAEAATVPKDTATSGVEAVSSGMSSASQGARASRWVRSLFCSA